MSKSRVDARLPQLAEVLPLIMERCADANILQTLQSLLLVSTSCRSALQQSRGHCEVTCPQHPSAAARFAAWLPEHAGLVSEIHQRWRINLSKDAQVSAEVAAAAGAARLSQQLLHSALQLAAAPQHLLPGNAPAQLLPLRLNSFSCGYPADVAVIRALAAAQVQSLVLMLDAETVTPALCEAISRLSCLKHLEVKTTMLSQGVPVTVTAALSSLQNLTSFSCGSSLLEPSAQHLPDSICALTTMWDATKDNEEACVATTVDLGRLTNLRRLYIRSDEPVHAVLPPQLSRLCISGGVDVQGDLRDIQVLELMPDGQDDLAMLQMLGNMPLLHTLYVERFSFEPRDQSDLAAASISAALGKATALTSLTLDFQSTNLAPELDFSEVPLCAQVCKLQQLRAIRLVNVSLSPRDVLHLSKLTGLTKLDLHVAEGVDDCGAVVLACELTGLQVLRLTSYDVTTAAVLPVLGRLQALRKLALDCSFELCGEDLQHLSKLTNLKTLRLHEAQWGSDAAKTRAAVLKYMRNIPGFVQDMRLHLMR